MHSHDHSDPRRKLLLANVYQLAFSSMVKRMLLDLMCAGTLTINDVFVIPICASTYSK